MSSIDPTKNEGTRAPVPGSAPFQIQPLKNDSRYIKIMIYGGFGTGKTTLAGSAADVPEMHDILFVDAESGTMSVEESPYISEEGKDHIFRVRCETFKKVALVQEYLKAHCKARDANDEKTLRALEVRVGLRAPDDDSEARRFRTVIVDSLTEIDTFSLYDLLGIETDMKLDTDKMEVAQFAEFRKNNQMMQLLVRAYRDLPMNVIMVCSSQFIQDELKQMLWKPALTGKLAGQVQGFVDIVGYLQVGKVPEGGVEAPRRLYVQPVGKFDAKNRRGSYRQAYFDNPTIGSILKAVTPSKPVAKK